MPTTIFDSQNQPHNLVDIIKAAVSSGGGNSVRIYAQALDPKPEDGENGDITINTKSGDLFKKSNGKWDNKGNLKGPSGHAGKKGKDGKDGVGIKSVAPDDSGDNLVFTYTDGSTSEVKVSSLNIGKSQDSG